MVLLKAADVCANITDVVLDHAEHGPVVWARFRADASQQVWYYGAGAELALERLEGYQPLRLELEARLAELYALPVDARTEA